MVDYTTVQLHADLRNAFRKALGWKLLNRSLWPAKRGLHNWLLWVMFAASVMICTLLAFANEAVRYWIIPAAALWIIVVLLPIAEWCIQREFKAEYDVCRIQDQPWLLRRPLLHYVFFHSLSTR